MQQNSPTIPVADATELEWTEELERAWQDNQAELEQPWLEAERRNERRFSQWLAFPGDR